MTDSFYSAIGKASFAPPDISKTNYMQTEADMVESVNNEIDRIQQTTDDYYDGLVQYYNHEYEKPVPMQRATTFLNELKGGLDSKKKIDKWLEFRKRYGEFEDLRFDKNKLKHINFDWTLQDKDIRKYRDKLPEMDLAQQKNYEAAIELHQRGEYGRAQVFLDGLGNVFSDNVEDDRTALSLLSDYDPIYRPKAEAGMKVYLDFGPYAGDYKTYNDVLNHEESRLFISRTIDAYFAFRHEDLFKGRLGKFKYEFVSKLIEKADARTTKVKVEQGQVQADAMKQRRAQDIKQRIIVDPGYIPKALNIYGHMFKKADGTVDHAIMKADLYATLENAVRADPSIIPYVVKALNHPFEARDGHMTTANKLFKKESASLNRVINEINNEEVTARETEKDNEESAWVDTAVEKWEQRTVPGTARERYKLITDWGREFKQVDLSKAPDKLKNLAYEGLELDEDIDFRLKKRAARGEEITEADLGAISDPLMLDKWRKHIKENEGVGLNFEGIEKAKAAINAEIAKRLGEDIQTVSGNPLYQINLENAYRAYLDEWRRIKKNQPGVSDEAAHGASMAVVKAGFNTKVVDKNGVETGDYLWDIRRGGWDKDLKTDVQTARKAIIAQPTLIASNSPLPGEEPYLTEAALYIQTTNARVPGLLPSYYRMLAKNMPGKYEDPELLLRSRLAANGLLDEDQVIIPEYKNLPLEKAKELTVNPTSCKTYITMQNIAFKEEDINWMLDIVKDPTAMDEGGYDYVVSPRVDGGKDAHLDKPLTQHTVGEVLALAESGHSDFGAYGITADGLISIIRMNQIPLDIPFDENTQDLFVLGRLRQKAQVAQSLSTQQDAYRRLVNIRPEDNERFLEIAGDLPPFLQLSNMIPACSTELVNQTLQR